MADSVSDGAFSICFSVSIDGKDLGAFTSCDGLGVEVSIEQREEGGNGFFVHQLAGRLRYTNVKLTRPINGDTSKVAQWFAGMATGVRRTNAEIVALTHLGERVAKWSLMEVIPVRWSGPSFTAESGKVLTETLEIAHHGFMEPGSVD